jgi:diguanylate cyclase (GGDEF)-like protein
VKSEMYSFRPGRDEGGGDKAPTAPRKTPFRDMTEEFRISIVKGLLKLCLLIGLLFIAPVAFMAVRDGDLSFLTVCGIAYAMIVVLYLNRSLAGPILYFSLIFVIFAIGIYIFLRFGSGSTGAIWLCSTTVLATIFFGLPGVIASTAVQALFLLALGIAQALGAFAWRDDPVMFSMQAIDVIGLGIIMGVAQYHLLGGLHKANEARGRLVSELSVRHAELLRETAGRHDAELRADFLESHDPLTRLPNRETFELSLARALKIAASRGRILGVMAIGIDRFKRVVETHGPGAGDAILIEIGVRLARCFHEGDLIARSGGDVFLVLLSDIKSTEDAKRIIEKSKHAFDRSFSVDGSEIGLSASFGLVLYPNDGSRTDSLIRAAEAALQHSKRDGPGSYRLYDPKLHESLAFKLKIEHELRGALRAEAFLPWFQPKVDRNGRIIGAEALVRWLLPNGCFRQPAEFIEAAERSGHIADLGRIVLAKACAAAVAWESCGLSPIPISVNLSPFQFRSEELVRDVRRILAATGLPASRLDLEITESGIVEDEAGAIEKLAELKSLGCSITIDDFGTGYSSFATLRDFPVDSVKLPKSFVEPLPSDSRASTIAGAVIDLAHRLHFTVVAEGVENADQFAWLGEADCDQYQGFLFARPMPGESFAAALAGGLPSS